MILKENLDNLNKWICTLYSLMHCLKVSKDNDFESREELNKSGKDSLKWNIEKNNFESITHPRLCATVLYTVGLNFNT